MSCCARCSVPASMPCRRMRGRSCWWTSQESAWRSERLRGSRNCGLGAGAGRRSDNTRLYEQEQRLHRKAEAMAITQQRTAEEIRSLYDVAQALVENMGLEDRLTTLAGQLVKVMRVDRCVIWLREGDALVPRTIVGVSEEEKEAWRGVQI